jgi:hypothetical protein
MFKLKSKPKQQATPKVLIAKVAPIYDVRCGLAGDELGTFVRLQGTRVLVQMKDHAFENESLRWHPEEVVPITGVASPQTVAALTMALEKHEE